MKPVHINAAYDGTGTASKCSMVAIARGFCRSRSRHAVLQKKDEPAAQSNQLSRCMARVSHLMYVVVVWGNGTMWKQRLKGRGQVL